MNNYLIAVNRYFGGTETFEIEAENKADALEKARVSRTLKFIESNVDVSTLRVVKKIKKK